MYTHCITHLVIFTVRTSPVQLLLVSCTFSLCNYPSWSYLYKQAWGVTEYAGLCNQDTKQSYCILVKLKENIDYAYT